MSGNEPGGGPSARTVVVALLANLGVALAKAVATLMTGSAAMAAETAHSIADTFNELFLYAGVRSSQRPADPSHPHAYGRDHYFWSLLAAVGIFTAGGIVAVWQGVNALRFPRPVESVPVGLGVLAASAVFEGWSWWTSHQQIHGEAATRGVDLTTFVRHTSDPAPVTVFFEDSAALVGIALAAAGLGLHAWTGNPAYDAMSSIAVGLLLMLVAWRLVTFNRRLISGAAAPAPTVERLTRVATRLPWVASVPDARIVVVGPRAFAVSLDVEVDAGTGTVEQLLADVAVLRHSLLDQQGVVVVDITPVAPVRRSTGGDRIAG